MSQKKTRILDKRIPTLLGLTILIFGLVIGAIFFKNGTGVFSPRATPETTPKNIKVSNVTDRSFTISFATDTPTVGFIKYGTKPDEINIQIGDERDQLYGSINSYTLHHITASGLSPNTTYYYVIGTNKGALFDENGQPFSIKTGPQLGAPPKAVTLYGAVSTAQSTPAEGAIVYVNLEGAGPLSQLVQKTGSWVISLSNARTSDGNHYATISDSSILIVLAQGHPISQTALVNTTVSGFINGTTIVLGTDESNSQNNIVPSTTLSPTVTIGYPTPTSTDSGVLTPTPTSTDSGVLTPTPTATDTSIVDSPSKNPISGGLSKLVETSNKEKTEDESDAVVDLTSEDDQVVDSGNPIIQGKAPPNVTVVIRVNSDSQIEQRVQSDKNGDFYLDIASLSQELEPGEHTVEYSYVDPITGQEVTQTRTFVVSPPQSANAQLAQSNISPTPVTYGTDYPYSGLTTPIPSSNFSTPSGSNTTTPSPTTNLTSTMSANASTQSAQVVNDGTLTEAGSVSTTLALLLGGFLFMLTGVWSFWVAKELSRD